jgi:hypothetical protein
MTTLADLAGLDGLPPDIEAEVRRLLALTTKAVAAKQESSRESVVKYLHDPSGFARECIDWEKVPRSKDEGAGAGAKGLAKYQGEILDDLDKKKRVAVRGPRGLGKSAIGSITVLWFALTREAAGIDWKIVTTAGAWQQLKNYFWPEVHKWSSYIRWDVVRDGRPPKSDELMRQALRLPHGLALAAAPTDSAKIEGAHASAILIMFDEAKLIPATTWDAIEGAMSGGGEALALALSTPGDPQGRFYDIHIRKKGLEDWTARHVTLREAIRAGQISKKWADQRIKQYGRTSQFVQCHVLGEFHSADEDAVIPLSWIEDAVTRWHAWADDGKPETQGPRSVGCDIAGSGSDMTVLAIRHGPVVTELRKFGKQDTMATTGKIKGILDADAGMTAVVDSDGIGKGVYDRLREQKAKAEPFTAAKTAGQRRDVSGEYMFADWRSYAWWKLREALDPRNDPEICLPDDDLLIGDLCAPKYKVESRARIKVESKVDIRKRIGRSTDDGDSVVMCMVLDGATWLDAYGVTRCESCDKAFMARLGECPHCGAAKAA